MDGDREETLGAPEGEGRADPEADATAERDPDQTNATVCPEARARRKARILRRLYLQWTGEAGKAGNLIVLRRTVPEDPEGERYLRLLGLSRKTELATFRAWADAQFAAEANPVGRLIRPVVELIPAAGTWTVARDVGIATLVEEACFPSPVRALRAAELRWRRAIAGALEDPSPSEAMADVEQSSDADPNSPATPGGGEEVETAVGKAAEAPGPVHDKND